MLALAAGLTHAACLGQGEVISYTEPPAEEAPTDDDPPEEELACPYTGDPLVDVSALVSCEACGDGHCVLTAILPAETAASFNDCADGKSKCMPDIILTTRGNFIPPSCVSALGAEGRCLSRCLPGIDEKADSLPQASCTEHELCVPCFDPFTQEPTGACDLGCDPGPAEAPLVLDACCSGDGVCLPRSAVADQADNLGQDMCPQGDDEEYLCVPEAFLDPSYQPLGCTDTMLIGSDLPGVCLPQCLPAVQGLLQDFILDQEGCPPEHRCAPCDHPITGDPTGACDL